MTGNKIFEENFSIPKEYFRMTILFHWRRGQEYDDTYEEMYGLYGKYCCTKQNVYNWFKRFDSGDFSLEDKMHVGKQFEVEKVEKIKEIVKEDPSFSEREISRELNIAKSTVHNYLTLYGDLEWVKERIVPSMLTEEDKIKRVEICKQMLEIVRDKQKHNYIGLITGDESWIYLRSHKRGEWQEKGEKKPEVPRDKISDAKIMLAVFFSVKGIHVVHRVPDKTTLKREEYIEEVMTPACKDARKTLGTLKLVLHHDNAPIHKGGKVEEFLVANHVHLLPQPPRSPDISPCDFYLWGRLKTSMMGMKFDSHEQQLVYIKKFFSEIKKDELQRVFDEWESRLQWVIDNEGDYYEE